MRYAALQNLELLKGNLSRFLQNHDSVSHVIMNSAENSDDIFVFPGFCDVHVHFREPGFSYKETIRTGSLAAARGGYTTVCAMPNLNPVPDTPEHLEEELRMIREQAVIQVLPYGAITMGEKGECLADLKGMAEHAVAFSDDGRGVQSEDMMLAAMEEARRLKKVIAAHCEDNRLVRGGCIHDGEYARAHGLKGIVSESEYGPIRRDVELVKRSQCSYHVCHVSCAESVDIIRRAKQEGVDITCETAPHYLVMDEGDLQDEGRFKMNPPLRTARDREALIEGLLDGTIDMIATDHAPHAAHEKDKGLAGSAFGIVGLETAFPVLYTRLVLPGILSLDRLVEALTVSPRKRFGIPEDPDSFSIWNLKKRGVIDPAAFASMGRATPFEGMEVQGVCLATVYRGEPVYVREQA